MYGLTCNMFVISMSFLRNICFQTFATKYITSNYGDILSLSDHFPLLCWRCLTCQSELVTMQFNFMNSAIGSKAASFKVIMVIAAIGIFVGASLSNGMMDIARHGIYQPQHFYFSEIMCIFAGCHAHRCGVAGYF